MKRKESYTDQGVRVLQLLLILTIILTGCGITQHVGDISDATSNRDGTSYSHLIQSYDGSDMPDASSSDSSETSDTSSANSTETSGENSSEVSDQDTSSSTTEVSTETSNSSTLPSDGAPRADLRSDPAGAVPQCSEVDAHYFDDAVFIGDSISVMLSYYEAANDRLGGAQFLASTSLGSANAMRDVTATSVHPTYQGEKMRLEQSVPLTGAKKMYIMLGMNDLYFGPQLAADNLTKLVESILEQAPDIEVYIQSMTPVSTLGSTYNTNSTDYNAVKIKQYNDILAGICREKGWYYINVASVFADENGYLISDYCSDLNGMGIHFTMTGCKYWVDYLLTHVPQ